MKELKVDENNKLEKEECPMCGHKTLVYTPPKKTEYGFFPANCDCLNCGYSTSVAVFDGKIIWV